jgi:deoxyribodipyrimidine photo-lyase
MSIDMGRMRQIRTGLFNGNCVLYWMVRDKRVHDNWALLEAQKIAVENKVPLLVCFNYHNAYQDANLRQYSFSFYGLQEVHKDLNKLNIQFYLLSGLADTTIPKFIEENKVGHLFTDFTPLKIYTKRLQRVVRKTTIPVTQVDAHNIIPVWNASPKKEYAAYTIRPKIKKLLPAYLIDIPQLKKHPVVSNFLSSEINWKHIIESMSLDKSVKPVDWINPGEKHARSLLEKLKTQLIDYNEKRNNPNLNKLSNMSPYFHFGQIAPQRVALEIKNSNLPIDDKEAFLEEMIVRRELADNFCFYEKNYDFFEGYHNWAQKSLNEHRDDEREYVYSPQEFEASVTHDELWNAAQDEMKTKGKMHGFMRMYWAKKILEWSPSPELAHQTAIELNDKYQLDGRDPNGYAGIAWSIGGVHDRAWFERPVFGKVRYMNYNGCKRKFNIEEYIKNNRIKS